jgi:hypothetical protein
MALPMKLKSLISVFSFVAPFLLLLCLFVERRRTDIAVDKSRILLNQADKLAIAFTNMEHDFYAMSDLASKAVVQRDQWESRWSNLLNETTWLREHYGWASNYTSPFPVWTNDIYWPTNSLYLLTNGYFIPLEHKP